MSSRFSVFCERVMEAGWLLAAMAVPLFFDIYSSRVFEPDKITLVRSIALVVATAWVAKQIETGFTDFRGGSLWARLRAANPLTVPVLLLVLVYALSTVLSVAQYVSIWGSYQRLQGTYSMFSYITVFAVMLHALRSRAQLERLFTVIVLTSLPISAYGWLQHFRLDPLPWGGDVSDRIASNMGNSIFVGAYLIMVMPITLGRWLNVVAQVLRDPVAETGGETVAPATARTPDDTPQLVLAGAYTFTLAFQLLAIYWTLSRGAWIGFMAGTYVFVLIGLTLLRQWVPDRTRLSGRETLTALGAGVVFPLALLLMPLAASLRGMKMSDVFRRTLRWMWLSWIVTGAVVIGLILAMNIPGTPLAEIKKVPGIGRLGEIFELDQGTNKVRALIWEGAAQLVAPHDPIGFDQYTDIFNVIRPLIGYGPEAMYVAYNSFYPPDLGHLEARNASPDRSHNETWDSLVTTGLFGFLVYVTLFGSVFYHALKWLGFASGARDRNLFIVLWVLGAVTVGVIAVAIDKQPRLLGVALPVGMLIGLMTYLAIQVFFVRQHVGSSLSTEDKVLIMALLSALIGSFAEIHFGISIAATRTYFWIGAALLVLIGHRLNQTAPVRATAVPTPPAVRDSAMGRNGDRLASFRALRLPAWSGLAPWAVAPAAPVTFARRRHRAGTPGAAMPAGRGAAVATARPAQVASFGSGTHAIVVYGMLLGIMLTIMGFDYISPNLATADKFSWIVMLFVFTLIVGALIMSAQIKATTPSAPRGLVVFAGVAVIALGVAGLYLILHNANLTGRRPTNVIDNISIVADVIGLFYLYLFGMLLALAIVLAGERTLPPRTFAEPFYLLLYVAIAAGCAAGIATTNLNSIRADIFYKQGLNFDGSRQFDGSLCMYESAINLAPDQDFYYLFYGRSFLEKAKTVPDNAPAQPLYNCYPGNNTLAFKDPPGISKSGSQRTRLIETARVFLTRARDLNPLNTDHTANLARMYRTWADLATDATQRADYVRQSIGFYAQAQALSPHNAQIYNEYSSAYMMAGETDNALAKLQESIKIDDEYAQTYLLLGDLYTGKNDMDNAVTAYQAALKTDATLLQAHSALGLIYSRQGKLDLAIQENMAVVAQQPNDYNSLRNLALLYRDAGRLPEAISYAQRALAGAPDADKPALQQFIAQLQAALAGGTAPQTQPTPPVPQNQPTAVPTPGR
ncbi:MAG: tetratricopeptide repeat protein [Chloroflexi bacterium]|nr:tetratricopeptide repeat protein [Chloroflexota bacterium]